MLSDEQRHRLEKEQNSFEQAYILQSEKIAKLRHALIIETDPSRKFQYEQQIQQEENELKKLADRLNEIEKQLQSASSQSSIFSAPDFSDFWGRTKELEILSQRFSKSRITLIYGEPGVGKTYLAAQFAKDISKDYRVLWIDKEGLTLEQLMFYTNEMLQEDNQYGFITTYTEEDLTIKEKIPTLVDVISSNKIRNYVFFIDNFQRADKLNFKFFFERFNTHGGDSKIILIAHSTADLTLAINTKIQRILISGFHDIEASAYINKCSEDYEIKLTEQDIQKIIKETAGHPLAINLIVQCCTVGTPLDRVLKYLVEYDKRFGDELHKKMLEDVAHYLNEEEEKAMHRLAVFRTPILRSSWMYLDISDELGESLLQRRLLALVGNDKFQMHPLIRQFWWESIKDEDEKLFSHKKAGYYYWNLAKKSWQGGSYGVQDILDFDYYSEAYYHFNESNQQELVEKVIDEFICVTHQQERLLLGLRSIKTWLPELDESMIVDKPWLLLEKARKLEKDTTHSSRKKAEILFSQAYDSFEQLGDKLGASIALYYKGKILHLSNQPESALRVLKLVLEIAESRRDVPMQIRTLGKLVSCNTALHQYDEAWSAADCAEKLACSVGDRLGQALILYRKGSVERYRSNFEQAEKYFSESAESFEALGDKYRTSKSLSRLGIVQDKLGKFESAITNLNQAIEIKNSLSDKYGLALDIDYLGDVYRSQGLHKQAKDCYQQSLIIKEKQGDIYGIVKSCNNLARTALLNGQLAETATFLKRSEEGIEELKIQNAKYQGIEGAFLTLKGDYEFKIRDYTKALKYYETAQKFFVTSQHSYARVAVSLGRIYLELRDFGQARASLNEALKFFRDHSTRYHEALTLSYLARLEALYANLEEAEENHQLAFGIAKEIGAKDVLSSCDETEVLIEILKYYFNDLWFFQNKKYEKYKPVLVATYRSRLSVFADQIEEAKNDHNLALKLVADLGKDYIDNILMICNESEGIIEEGETLQLAHSQTTKENNKIKEKLINKVWREYDKALQKFIVLKSVPDIAKLQIKKNLWRLVVKLLLNELPIFSEEDYASLASLESYFDKDLIEEVIYQEILTIKYTLISLHTKKSNLAVWRAKYFLKIISPLVKRLNLSLHLDQLENLAFQVIHPIEFQEITEYLTKVFNNQESFAVNVKQDVEKKLKESGIKAEVTYRIKAPYSIYRKKTERKGVTLEKILDMVGLRIITETVDDCYIVLSIVESLGERFEGKGILAETLRDYIKNPKLSTGYQSIHINVKIPGELYQEKNSHIIEFQIRTQAMHAHAEIGESAHSYYKDTLRYSKPNLTKDFKGSLKSNWLLIECEKSLIGDIGTTIRSMNFDILSVDIKGTLDGRILLKVELRARNQNSSSVNESSIISSLIDQIESLSITDT